MLISRRTVLNYVYFSKMKFHILHIFCTLAVKSVDMKNSPKVARGVDAYPGQFPWMISLEKYQIPIENNSGYWEHRCGGAIIDRRHVISAAHCALGDPLFRVLVGAHNISDPTEPFRKTYNVCRVHLHPKYNYKILTNDMMVITLANPIIFNERVQPIRLAPPDSDPVGQHCVVSGWGWLDDGRGAADVLQTANQTAVKLEECQSWNDQGPFYADSSCVCTHPSRNRGGDSGSAVVCYDEKGPFAYGVASWYLDEGDFFGGVKAHLDFIKCRNSTEKPIRYKQ